MFLPILFIIIFLFWIFLALLIMESNKDDKVHIGVS